MNNENTKTAGVTRDREGRIIHPASDELWLDPRSLRSGRTEVHIFPLLISKQELTAVPAAEGLENDTAQVTCTFKVLDDCIVCTMQVDSRVALIDEATLKLTYLDCSDWADLSLSKDPDMADVMPDERGRYDLKPTALALFFSSVPSRYSSNPEASYEGDGFEVISEDEYNRRLASSKKEENPFEQALGSKNSEK